jgi:hypothetical protein
VFRDGKEISGTWQRAALSDSTSLVAADGSTIALHPGQTWIEIVPSTVTVSTTATSATSGAPVSTTAQPTSSTPPKAPVSPAR